MMEVASVPGDHRLVSTRRYDAGPPLDLVEPGETVATTKEEEWVSTKKTEITNRKQIETRVKRQVVLEDGKVVEDSGPLVTTNTTEDSETQEHHQTELKKLGPDGEEIPEGALEEAEDRTDWVAVPNPDGIVREVKERRVLSREETEELKETEDIHHLGDITDEDFLAAVHSGSADIRPTLRKVQDGGGRTVVSTGPKLVHESLRKHKTTDTEDTRELSSVRPDGRIVTETERTTEHEEVRDEDLPDGVVAPEDTHQQSSQRYLKTRDEEEVEYLADGVKIGGEMRLKTETMEAEKRGDKMEEDWDSLSARVRRRQQTGMRELVHRMRGIEGGVPATASPLDRKDALTKKPLDFDQEEETRKVETSKWLEHHFGSESRSSKDSVDDEVDEQPPTTSFFNVTIKSQPTQIIDPPSPPVLLVERDRPETRRYVATVNTGSSAVHHQRATSPRYYQGVTEWSERTRVSPTAEMPVLDVTPTPPQRKRAQERRDRMIIKTGSGGGGGGVIIEDRYEHQNYINQSHHGYNHHNGHGHHNGSNGHGLHNGGQNYNHLPDKPQEEPPPDYAMRRSPSPQRIPKKHNQRTRFAADPPKAKHGNIIGQSIRKLVGKIRSASAERKNRQRAKRSPSPQSTYQQGHVIDSNIPGSRMRAAGSRQQSESTMNDARPHHQRRASSPVQRYYLGEDPFGGSIYGRENKYDGVRPVQRSSRKSASPKEEVRSHSTLGRLGHSNGRVVSHSAVDLSRTSQTLPRHMPPRHERHEPPTRLSRNDVSNSTINVSIINRPLVNGGPAKPARTYRSNLARSKSFNVHAGADENDHYLYKSNPHLHRLDENPIGLKSPGIVSSISRSQRDLTSSPQLHNVYNTGGRTTTGVYKEKEASKKVFMKNLKDHAPELFKTLHEDETWDPPNYSTPLKSNGHYNTDIYEPPQRLTDTLRSSASPTHRIIRRGSNSSNEYAETYHMTSRSDDPRNPSVTNTVQSFSKKVIPTKDGRAMQTIESTETKSVTKSRYRGDPVYSTTGGGRPMTNGSVVIEVRNRK